MEILMWLGTFLLMEGIAWFTHKYIMHGVMWNWHESHHVHHKNALEKNDLFSVVFGVLSTLTIILGAEIEAYRPLLWIGLGIASYGLCYFIFHDIIVHRRIKVKFKTKNTYLKRLIKAHYVHHEVHEKEGAEAFGFLYAPKKYE
ncbi:Beta-carotene 3-hydroxylase [Aquirufa nivalisilvae]|uniref:Beta-carotene 3-hydroxylase n=1 Tax=Aquirufa nivalisilvae TaxID=2516557 RepID=A0A2S2DXI7_9BACT|nr:sterol desaturase family protein [Aquirufa nivalisilvae]AWL10124.1 Beta-carotene 3-hydroxylase [Aquirufa nivalisilvae]